jgi:hypothetical protein
MLKRLSILILLSLFAACGGNAPQQRQKPIDPYIIISSMADPTTNSYRMMIRVDPPITEENVKKAAEKAIEKFKGQFAAVTVQSYTTSDTNTVPYAVSRYDGSGVSHQFNPQAAPQKIPSH